MIGCSCTRFGKGIIEVNALACHIYTKQAKLVSIGSKFPAQQIDRFFCDTHNYTGHKTKFGCLKTNDFESKNSNFTGQAKYLSRSVH